MKKSGMKATSLRSTLVFLMIVVIAGAGAGFYFGLEQIRTYALDVSHTAADADASGKRVEELQRLKVALAQSETLVNKANKIFATEANYQSQALKDVQKYASDAGITISNTTFGTPTPGGETEQQVAPTNSHSIIITLQTPVSYSRLLQFLDSIEGNLPKMQITSLTLSRPATESGDTVFTEDITIAISTR
jgi:hypothetical protein